MKIVNQELLNEFRQQPCELCGAGPPSDPHHIFCRGMGGGRRLDIRINLVSLCRDCHNSIQGNRERFEDLCRMVLEREIWRFLRAPKEQLQHYREN